MDFTVSELAEAVAPVMSYPKAPSPEQVDLIIRRIRSWTVAGALRPHGDPYSGTGKHRRYGADSLSVAAVLNVLAQNDQNIGTLLQVAIFIRNLSGDMPLIAGKTLDRWRAALRGDEALYLVTSKTGDTTHWGIVAEDELARDFRKFLGGIHVNLTDTLRRIKPA